LPHPRRADSTAAAEQDRHNKSSATRVNSTVAEQHRDAQQLHMVLAEHDTQSEVRTVVHML
jgi:hypothetical protein